MREALRCSKYSENLRTQVFIDEAMIACCIRN